MQEKVYLQSRKSQYGYLFILSLPEVYFRSENLLERIR